MARTRGYQFDYSKILAAAMYDCEARERKAKTILAVFRDYFKADFKSFSLLDVGCSTGFISNHLAGYFGQVLGIDIDEPAIDFARKNFNKQNLGFVKIDSQQINFPENTFDVAICAHIYEHVPDAEMLMAEIYRVLKADGVCYFAAGNRLRIMEPHYHLPFLSTIPRPMAHAYLRLTGRGEFYYEKHLSYWALKKLTHHFERIDYTRPIIEQPDCFSAEYMLPPNSNRAKLAKFISKYAYWLCPTYIWLLRKSAAKNFAS